MRLIVEALNSASDRALFVTEVIAQTGIGSRAVEDGLTELAAQGRCVVVDHPFHDPHVSGDLRVAALVVDESPRRAVVAAAAHKVWDQWLREFLQTHRCS